MQKKFNISILNKIFNSIKIPAVPKYSAQLRDLKVNHRTISINNYVNKSNALDII